MSGLNALRRRRAGACGVACALLLSAGCAVFVSPATDARFEPSGPDDRQVVAFLAPYDPRGTRTRDAYAAALVSLRQGLSRVVSCSELPPEAIHLILVERVTVVRGQQSRDFELPAVAGIVLMDGTREPLLVDAGAEIAAIPAELVTRVGEYFAAPGCAP